MPRGGAYKTQGADTCVYVPQVACAKKGTRRLRPSSRRSDLISRITRDKYEEFVQKAVIKTIVELSVEGNDISKYFNLAEAACQPEFKPEDNRGQCTVGSLQGNPATLINLVTPPQGDTLAKTIRDKSKPDVLMKTSLKAVMIAMARMNQKHVTHSDSHFNNLGWIGDQLVIFDWGRGTVNDKTFKTWVNKYISWDKPTQENWKTFSQHTLQFSLIDDLIQSKTMNKHGLYKTLQTVWDSLGLLGPARAAGVVSEPKSAAFMTAVFTAIKGDPKQGLTERLINTLIPALFEDPPAVHAVVAEQPMPPAEARALSRIIPSVVEVPAQAPEPAAGPPDRKLEDMKEACRKLLAPGGGTRRRKRLPQLR